MKIGLLSPPWVPVPPRSYGGTESVIDVMARGLVDAGHDVHLFATTDSTCPVPKSAVMAAAAGEDIGNAVLELHQVLDGYEALADCDIVHDHTLAGPVLAAQAGANMPPVITTAHGPMDGALAPIYRALSGRVPIIAISHSQARMAPVPVEAVIHHGIDVSHYRAGDGRGGYLAFLGRMCADKGAHRAIDVARKAGRPLKIAAKMREPAERAYFEAFVEPHLDGDIEYVGELGHDDKVALVGDALALINPIAWPEPFGLVMIESLACGTPVLTRPVGAAPEIVLDGRTGFLADDLGTLAAMVDRVSTLDRRLCRSSVEARFSAEAMVREHVRTFEQVIARRRAGARPAARGGSVVVEREWPVGGSTS